jgi:hypothetical protein
LDRSQAKLCSAWWKYSQCILFTKAEYCCILRSGEDTTWMMHVRKAMVHLQRKKYILILDTVKTGYCQDSSHLKVKWNQKDSLVHSLLRCDVDHNSTAFWKIRTRDRRVESVRKTASRCFCCITKGRIILSSTVTVVVAETITSSIILRFRTWALD